MKKLITLILALALLLPSAASLADDPDPIVGCWYMYYDKKFAPELSFAMGDTDKEVSVYLFSEDGLIYLLDGVVAGNQCTPTWTSAGKWGKKESGYTFSIIGMSSGELLLEDDSIWVEAASNHVAKAYMRFRKLFPFDPYNDYKYQ